MLGMREFIKLVCSCAICHASTSVEIPYGTQKKYCCTGSLAQIRALTRDGPLDKVNGILVPPTLLNLRSTVSNTKDRREVLAAGNNANIWFQYRHKFDRVFLRTSKLFPKHIF